MRKKEKKTLLKQYYNLISREAIHLIKCAQKKASVNNSIE